MNALIAQQLLSEFARAKIKRAPAKKRTIARTFDRE